MAIAIAMGWGTRTRSKINNAIILDSRVRVNVKFSMEEIETFKRSSRRLSDEKNRQELKDYYHVSEYQVGSAFVEEIIWKKACSKLRLVWWVQQQIIPVLI